jgi:manganese/zinc/iron transport system permease protein
MSVIEVMAIAIVTTIACVLPGVFLVLRGVAMMSDAISHAALLGIVGVFFVINRLDSPFFLVGAAMVGVLTVSMTEWLIQSGRVKKDAAIGLVFPLFFAIAVILITRFAGQIHLDTDAVILGEIAFAPFDRLIINGIDFGPKSLVVMGIIATINAILVKVFYKELSVSTFDPGLAMSLGISPILIHYMLMIVTSVTAVGAFNAVGSILVVALMITPPATAYLLTNRLSMMVVLSVWIGTISALLGVMVAMLLDVSISGAIATVTGLLFAISLLISPKSGVIVKMMLVKRQRREFSLILLLVQLLSHEGGDSEQDENTIENIVTHMKWTDKRADYVVRHGVASGYLVADAGYLQLTDLGRARARREMVRF